MRTRAEFRIPGVDLAWIWSFITGSGAPGGRGGGILAIIFLILLISLIVLTLFAKVCAAKVMVLPREYLKKIKEL